MVVAGYLGLMVVFTYAVADRRVDYGPEWLLPRLALQLAVGLFVGRWAVVAT